MVDHGIRDEVAVHNPEAIVLDNPSFDRSIIGVTDDGRVVYDYEAMVLEMAGDDDIPCEDAADFIDYNTIRAIPYMGGYAPVIVYRI